MFKGGDHVNELETQRDILLSMLMKVKTRLELIGYIIEDNYI